jgi:hypothetical protein
MAGVELAGGGGTSSDIGGGGGIGAVGTTDVGAGCTITVDGGGWSLHAASPSTPSTGNGHAKTRRISNSISVKWTDTA